MKIAIIGAGFTGCLLAELLKSTQHQITIFEKSRGCGGRASTKRTDWGQFDHGATIIPAIETPFVTFMQGLCHQQLATQWSHNIAYMHKADNQWQPTTKLSNERQFFIFNGKMNALCKAWIANTKCHTQSLVTAFRQQKDKSWQIQLDNLWQQESFDKVVLTAPWPQSQALISQANLPIDLSQYNQNWTSCWSIAMQTQPLKKPSKDLFYLKDYAIQSLVRDSAKPDRPKNILPDGLQGNDIWVAQLDNSLSDHLTKTSKEQAIELAKETLCDLLAIPQSEIFNHHAHYWQYARPSPGQTALGIIQLSKLGFYAAGDWSYGASIEAAFNAATRLKQAISNE